MASKSGFPFGFSIENGYGIMTSSIILIKIQMSVTLCRLATVFIFTHVLLRDFNTTWRLKFYVDPPVEIIFTDNAMKF